MSFLAFGTAVFNAATYWKLLAVGQLFRGASVPFSVFVSLAGLCAVLMLKRFKQPPAPAPPSQRQRLARLLVAGLVLIFGPVALIHQFGSTDYRRKADAVVVFGARVYADGRPSLALRDRIHTACTLVLEERAEWIIASGGPGDGGDGGITEAQAMRAYAESMGIDPAKVLVDNDGLNTASTCVNTTRLMQPGWRLWAVSHSYHLPRVKLAFAQVGLADRVRTVPAQQSRSMPKMPVFMARELAAWWAYFFEPLRPGAAARSEPAPLQPQTPYRPRPLNRVR